MVGSNRSMAFCSSRTFAGPVVLDYFVNGVFGNGKIKGHLIGWRTVSRSAGVGVPLAGAFTVEVDVIGAEVQLPQRTYAVSPTLHSRQQGI